MGVSSLKINYYYYYYYYYVAALTRSSLIWRENNTPNNKTMDPSPENNRAA